jgi:hypothetical protein
MQGDIEPIRAMLGYFVGDFEEFIFLKQICVQFDQFNNWIG